MPAVAYIVSFAPANGNSAGAFGALMLAGTDVLMREV